MLRFVVEKDTDRRIDALFAHYSRRKIPFVWLVHPSARPLDLADRLRARGLEEAEVYPGMSMDLRSLPEQGGPPAEVEIREVRDSSEVDEALELVAWRWNVPLDVRPALAGVMRAFDVGVPGGAVRCWIARRARAPVARVVLNLAAGAAGLYGVATRPEARGLGLARYLTLEALLAARREGYTLGVLQSTPMARSLYEKIGFRAVAPFRVFTPPDALHL